MTGARVIVWVMFGLLGGACAADAPGSRERNVGPGQAGGNAFGNAGSGAPVDFGNGARAGSSGGAPQQQMPPLAPQGEREHVAMDECPGAVPPETAAKLQDPNAAPGGRWLYPYDETVFPRGLEAPVLQWADTPGDASAVMIHLRSMLLDYRVCLPLDNAAHAQIPQAVWDLAAEQSRGKGDPLTVDVVLAGSSSATKLPTKTLIFALATLKGAIYYNTYGSLLANQMGVIGGVVMRVLPGQAQPDVYLTAPNPVTDCIGCHSVSADGSRLVAEIHGNPGTFEGPSAAYDLSVAGAAGVNPPPLIDTLRRAGFAALYPDGSLYVTTGRVQPGPIAAVLGQPVGNVPGTFGPEASKLYDTNTGAEIPNSGIAEYAYMPQFSVDGTEIVFNHMDASGAPAGHSLAVMDFDRASNTFSNLRTVFTDPTQYPGWPFFLPDVVTNEAELNVPRGKRVVFALGQMPDFATQEQPVGLTPHVSDLWWVDVDSGMAAPLTRANGTPEMLPYGERDAHKNYIPTVSPVAAGGYFWVFFTSKRNYGNLFVADPPELNAEAKKIWVAAIDIDAPPGSDPSHPAFFLPGQELESGNIRAFATLEPCRENGTTCESGIDCCCGFCIEGQCGCREGCAMIDEKCETNADCCDEAASCIGGYCGYLQVPD